MLRVNALAGFGGKARLPSLTFSFVDFSESASNVLSVVPGVQAGDVAYLFEYGYSFSGRPSLVPPSGWTNLVDNAEVANVRAAVFRKILTAGDISAGSITGMNGDLLDQKVMLAFRPSSTIGTMTDSTWAQKGTDGNPVAQTIAGAGQPAPLLAVGFACVAGGAPDPFSWTPAYDALITPVTTAIFTRAAYKTYNTSPADISVDMDDEGGGNVLTCGYSRFTAA